MAFAKKGKANKAENKIEVIKPIEDKKIIASKGMPFEIKLENGPLKDISKMTKEELEEEIMKGYENFEKGEYKTAEEVFKSLKKEYNI